mmetsp:Transcript_2529/g.8643  ORF Transcript_2529/g.8643 Transcript_2529/m.8643 type:complete len:210 (+) Transcript_2529:1200-1829(+)
MAEPSMKAVCRLSGMRGLYGLSPVVGSYARRVTLKPRPPSQNGSMRASHTGASTTISSFRSPSARSTCPVVRIVSCAMYCPHAAAMLDTWRRLKAKGPMPKSAFDTSRGGGPSATSLAPSANRAGIKRAKRPPAAPHSGRLALLSVPSISAYRRASAAAGAHSSAEPTAMATTATTTAPRCATAIVPFGRAATARIAYCPGVLRDESDE